MVTCMSPPTWTSLPSPIPFHPSRLNWAPDLNSLYHTANICQVSNFAYGNIYVSVLLSQFIPPSPSPAVCASLCSVPAFLFLPCNTGFMGTCDNLGHLRIHYVLNKWKLFPPFIPRLHGFENLFYSFRKIGDWAFLPVHNCKAHFGFRNNMRSRVPWH